MSYSLPPFPVPNTLVPYYGRGRRFFPEAVEFTVPLLCAATTETVPLFYFIVDVSLEWEQWKLALPQSSDNHVLCYSAPINAQGKHMQEHPVMEGYKIFTVGEIRRRLPAFWHNSVVLMTGNIWLPMESVDPFNLLGFTCLPALKTACDLPAWSDVPSETLAVSIIKPMYVNTPVCMEQLAPYEPVPALLEKKDQPSNIAFHDDALDAFDDTGTIELLTLKKIKATPSVAAVRDYMRGRIRDRKPLNLTITNILNAYYHSEQDIAYLCELEDFAQPVWIAEAFLELAELSDMRAFTKYRAAVDAFNKSVMQD